MLNFYIEKYLKKRGGFIGDFIMVKRLSELVSEMETNSLTGCADMVNYVLKNTLTGTERQPQALFM